MADASAAAGQPAKATDPATQDIGYPHGHLGHLTEDEEKALVEFKQIISEKGLYQAGPPPSHDDQTLL